MFKYSNSIKSYYILFALVFCVSIIGYYVNSFVLYIMFAILICAFLFNRLIRFNHYNKYFDVKKAVKNTLIDNVSFFIGSGIYLIWDFLILEGRVPDSISYIFLLLSTFPMWMGNDKLKELESKKIEEVMQRIRKNPS